jgi:hypothetical protein
MDNNTLRRWYSTKVHNTAVCGATEVSGSAYPIGNRLLVTIVTIVTAPLMYTQRSR